MIEGQSCIISRKWLANGCFKRNNRALDGVQRVKQPTPKGAGVQQWLWKLRNEVEKPTQEVLLKAKEPLAGIL